MIRILLNTRKIKVAENIKVMTILGTRPEIIRLSETMNKLDKYTEHIIVHTNQNYDYELNQVFFDEMKIRKPDYILEVKGETVGEQIGKILAQSEKVILKHRPHAILILGDTNSALACIIAKRLKIAVFHMEAGNRCFDDRVPEEINRRIVDHTSDINLCYTEHARRNLLREGLDPQNIFVTGSPLTEVYSVNQANFESSLIIQNLKLTENNYFLASIHREENVDNVKNLPLIIESLQTLAKSYNMPVVFSTHPRTRKRLEDLHLKVDDRIQFFKPFGFFDYVRLQKSAFCNLSDSGTIHEDAAILGIPAINVRESNERPEVYDAGNVIMTGVDPDTLITAVRIVRNQNDSGVKFANPYACDFENCSDKVVKLIVGLNKIVLKKKYYL
jgi:UDP-N-acetyl-L-fucosamine synthase